MPEELRQAIQELQRTETNLKEIDPDFQEVALLEYEAAKARVNALVKSAKEVKQNELNNI